MKFRLNDILQFALIATLYLAILCLFFSCKTQTVAIAPEIHKQDRDSIRTEYKHDSIYIDRIHKEFVKGDTVRIHDSIFVAKWYERLVHDSCYIHQTDSVPYPVEVRVNVPYKSGYTKFTSWFFWIVLIIGIGWGVWKIADYIPVLSKYKKIIKASFHLI